MEKPTITSLDEDAKVILHLSAAERATHRRKILHDLQMKAEEYLTALSVEVGLRVGSAEADSLQAALRQDFIEVHNAALKDPVPLPVTRDEIAKLLD